MAPAVEVVGHHLPSCCPQAVPMVPVRLTYPSVLSLFADGYQQQSATAIFVCAAAAQTPAASIAVKLYIVARCEDSCTRCLKEPHRPHLFHEGVSLTSKRARSCLQDDQGVASVLISGGSEKVCLRQAHGAVLFGWFSLFDLDIISTTVFLAQIGYGWRGWIISVLWRRNGGVLGSLKFTAVGRGGIMMEGLAP